MKVKQLVVEIKSIEKGLKEAQDVMERLERGEQVQEKDVIYFTDIDLMRKVLTTERLRLLKVVKEEKPYSIRELARFLKRDLKNVNSDVKYLAEIGLLELDKETMGRRNVSPSVSFDKLSIEVVI